ncbi:two-component system, response regulator YesN [Lentibacillus halodurans]|uniref:Two-component system, response regulator YesN n=1 Tax=Lentibacillus halodurans TaxID=237679 RepID=A0A1I0XP75_9BACI|nr:helix-turn-helix domain-containing protein [Lentibacillus halodurans]SFB01763.1 two-component system, response regulator YesN [Lentibacillus halodurans]
MRILIAEDELLERKSMCKFLAENFSDIDTINEAANGREAIEKAKQLTPDIIFMDIKMPGINGLEAIEEIQQISPFSKYILVSAYDSFDFAKQAMHYGVKEYILKPGKKEEIVSSILRVKKEIKHERKQQEEKRDLIEERFISRLMQQPLDKEAHTILRNYFPSFKSGFFLVVHMSDLPEKEVIQTKLANHVKHRFIVDVADGRVVCCILADSQISKSDMLMQARKIQLVFGEDCYVGLGYAYSALENFPKSYHDALTAVFQLEKMDNRKYGFSEKSDHKLYNSDVVVQLLAEVEKGNEHEAVELYKDNRNFFYADELEEFYFNVKRLMEDQNLALPGSSISELDTNEEWHHFITLCCLKFREHYQSKRLMRKVTEYIDEHYKQGITLEEMAGHVGLSPNYFSNVFKKVFGTTFVEYITGRRLNEAKRLIMENDYSLKEISYMVGYHDPNYFSRVFKKHYQLSPKKFQQQIFKK